MTTTTPRTAKAAGAMDIGTPSFRLECMTRFAASLERELADRIERLEEALKGTLYLFEAHAVSKTDLEQIRFARAALAGDKP